jgi:hypothetical protein
LSVICTAKYSASGEADFSLPQPSESSLHGPIVSCRNCMPSFLAWPAHCALFEATSNLHESYNVNQTPRYTKCRPGPQIQFGSVAVRHTALPWCVLSLRNTDSMLHCYVAVLDSASMTAVYPFHAVMHKTCNTANILTLHHIS